MCDTILKALLCFVCAFLTRCIPKLIWLRHVRDHRSCSRRQLVFRFWPTWGMSLCWPADMKGSSLFYHLALCPTSVFLFTNYSSKYGTVTSKVCRLEHHPSLPSLELQMLWEEQKVSQFSSIVNLYLCLCMCILNILAQSAHFI